MTDQSVIDRAVQIATRAALNGNPVARILWIRPASATDHPLGAFSIEYYENRSAADTPPWEE